MGLFAGQEQVLQALDQQKVLTMSDLAAILRVRVPTASKAVTRLAVLGFVERMSELLSDGRDRRTVQVKLTRKGKVVEFSQSLLEGFKRAQGSPLPLLGAASFEQALEELRRIAKLLDLDPHLVAFFGVQFHKIPSLLDDLLPAPAEFLLGQHRDRLATTLAGGLALVEQPIPSLSPRSCLQNAVDEARGRNGRLNHLVGAVTSLLVVS